MPCLLLLVMGYFFVMCVCAGMKLKSCMDGEKSEIAETLEVLVEATRENIASDGLDR